MVVTTRFSETLLLTGKNVEVYGIYGVRRERRVRQRKATMAILTSDSVYNHIRILAEMLASMVPLRVVLDANEEQIIVGKPLLLVQWQEIN